MNRKLFIKPYHGYGDWIIINGMVRFFTTKYEEVNLITDGGDIKFIQNLYRDSSKVRYVSSHEAQKNFEQFVAFGISTPNLYVDYLNLEIWEQTQENTPKNFYNRYKQLGKKFNLETINVGSDCYKKTDPCHNFSEHCKPIMENNASAFYVAAGVPKQCRVENFYYERDFESENSFFENMNLSKEYVVICEYGSNLIDRKYIKNKQLEIVNVNNISEKYFDVIKIIENAKEVHLIENSIALLVYHLQYKNLMNTIPINIHTYSRQESVRKCSSLDKSNIYLDMFNFPSLLNWSFIYSE